LKELGDNVNKNYKIAKILVLVPLIVFAIAVVCFIIATVLEQPTNRGVLYTAILLIGFLCMLLAPLPCLIVSIIGSLYAYRSKKEGARHGILLFIIGIVNTLVSFAVFVFDIYAVFVLGPGV
jgi:hypothetical protein